MSNELVKVEQYALVESKAKQEIAQQSQDLSLHNELAALRWQLDHAIESEGPESRRVVNLTLAVVKVAEAQARLALLSGHCILTSEARGMAEELMQRVARTLHESALIVLAENDCDLGLAEKIRERFDKLIRDSLSVVSEESAAKLNRQAGVK